MKHLTKTLQRGFAILLMASGLSFSGAAITANAQDKADKADVKAVPSRSERSGRDPFSKYVPARVLVKKSGGLITAPSIEQRIEQYKAQKLAAMNARVAAPKPTTAFLLNEIQVVGISRSPRGYAAIVEASPIKLAYVIYPGERFYDAQLVAIEDNRLVFRRETVYSDGRRDRSVEMKPLRQVNTVNVLSTIKTASASTPAAEPEKKLEQKTAADKP
jgi:hypothetical protein